MGMDSRVTQQGQVVASIQPKSEPEEVLWGRLVEKDGMLVCDFGVEVPDDELGKAIVEAIREHREGAL